MPHADDYDGNVDVDDGVMVLKVVIWLTDWFVDVDFLSCDLTGGIENVLIQIQNKFHQCGLRRYGEFCYPNYFETLSPCD